MSPDLISFTPCSLNCLLKTVQVKSLSLDSCRARGNHCTSSRLTTSEIGLRTQCSKSELHLCIRIKRTLRVRVGVMWDAVLPMTVNTAISSSAWRNHQIFHFGLDLFSHHLRPKLFQHWTSLSLTMCPTGRSSNSEPSVNVSCLDFLPQTTKKRNENKANKTHTTSRDGRFKRNSTTDPPLRTILMEAPVPTAFARKTCIIKSPFQHLGKEVTHTALLLHVRWSDPVGRVH